MMVLGREEPLVKNKLVYAFNEISGEVELSKVEDDGLNRYSFLWRGEFDRRNARFADLIRHIGAHLNQDPCWFLVWGTPRRDRNLVPDPKIDQRETEGWATHKGEVITIGQKMDEPDNITGPEPAGHTHQYGDGGTFLLMGDVPTATDLVGPPAEKTLRKFAETREMAPSSPFLSFVRERGLTLAYFLRDNQSQLGMITVTPHQLNLDSLKENGFADTLHDGDDALLAWGVPHWQ